MIIAFAKIITDVQVADTVAEFFDKFQNAPAAGVVDIGVAGVQSQPEIGKPLQNFNKISRLKKSAAPGKHILKTDAKP